MGTGHVMRMIALAQKWQAKGADVCFLCSQCPTALLQRLHENGFSYEKVLALPGSEEDLTQTLSLASSTPCHVVLDGYHFSSDYQAALRKVSQTLLVVDDYGHLDRYECDLLLNQNLGAETLGVPCKANDADCLLGLRYALLREEFLKHPLRKKPLCAQPVRLLVTLGGSDPGNVTGLILRALKESRALLAEVRVLVGAANPHRSSLESAANDLPLRVDFFENTRDMVAQMDWADVAISACGSTCWELAYVGVPMAVISIAENQKAILGHLASQKLAWTLGTHACLSVAELAIRLEAFFAGASARQAMAAAASCAIDGRGSSRVVTRILSREIGLRPATADDSRWIWALANDPAVRSASFLSNPIPWADHKKWFAQKIADPHRHLLCALDRNSQPLGSIRFEAGDASTSRISVALNPISRGKGIGSALILAGCEWLFANSDKSTIHAYIRPSNTASTKAFELAGFDFREEATVHSQPALLFQKRKD